MMKLRKWVILVLFTVQACVMPVYADAPTAVKIFIDGVEKQFSPPAMLIEDRTMVPLRGIFEDLGATVSWDGETQTASVQKGNLSVSLGLGRNTAEINGVRQTLDVAPVLIEDRTLVPLRVISEALSCEVIWDGGAHAVHINTISTPEPRDPLSDKSVVSRGNSAAIAKAMRKAQNGEDVVIGFLGGSITEGAGAKAGNRKYTYLVEQWWKKRFPAANIKAYNAGMGSTGSLLGVHRVDENILQYNPDFVIVEFAVNDEATSTMQVYYEQLVRKILQSENQPGLMLLFMSKNDGSNAQKQQAEIGAHYELPMISVRDALWPEIQSGKYKWSDYYADTVHPNDQGHAISAKFVTDELERIYAELDQQKEIPPLKPVLFPPERYIGATALSSDKLTPVTETGWRVDTDQGFAVSWRNLMHPGWEITEKNKPVVFEVEGNTIGIVYKKTNVATAGRASIKVDDGEPIVVDGFFAGGWGSYPQAMILADDLPDGKHRVEVTLLEEHNQNSTGELFGVNAILTSNTAD